jgi:hypothetical protein
VGDEKNSKPRQLSLFQRETPYLVSVRAISTTAARIRCWLAQECARATSRHMLLRSPNTGSHGDKYASPECTSNGWMIALYSGFGTVHGKLFVFHILITTIIIPVDKNLESRKLYHPIKVNLGRGCAPVACFS